MGRLTVGARYGRRFAIRNMQTLPADSGGGPESEGFRVSEAETAKAGEGIEQGGLRAMGMVIGCACGGLSVALIVFTIWVTAKGGEGMIPLLVGFALLLTAVGTLRPSNTRL